MQTRKKIISALLCAATVLLCFTGCDSMTQPADITEISSQTEATQETSEPETEEITSTEESSVPTTAAPTTAAPSTTAKPTAATAAQTEAPAAEPTTKNIFAWLNKQDEQTTAKKLHGEHFFDDAVFIGDSVSVGLKNYITSRRNSGKSGLGKAIFLCSGSLSYTNSQLPLSSKHSVHPKLNGKKVLIDDGVKAVGAKKAFIMLGMNDFCGYAKDIGIKNAKKLIGQIIAKNPGIEIYVESVTPVTKAKEHGQFNNANINAFNEKLKTMCSENGWQYIDIGSLLKDTDGCLKPSNCGDPKGMGIHMTFTACKIWTDYLVSHF